MTEITQQGWFVIARTTILLFMLAAGVLASPVYAQTFTLSGTVQLPNNELASEDISFSVQARRTPTFTIESDSNTQILQGQNSGSFNIQVFEPPMAGEQWNIVYFCNSGCNGYGSTALYSDSGSLTFISANFPNATLFADNASVSGIVFPVLDADQISGNVSLPAGEIPPVGDIEVSVSLVDTAGGAQFKSTQVTISSAEPSPSYSLNSPGADASTMYRISYNCISGCEGLYLDSGYYALPDTVLEENDASLLAGLTDHSNINLDLIKSSKIAGTLSLPSGQVAPAAGLTMSVRATNLNNTSQSYTQSVTIADQSSSTTYSLDILGATNASWLVTYSCFGCPGYFDNSATRYSENGTVNAFEAQTLLTGSFSYSGIDMNIVEQNTIAGSIALPSSTVANGDIELTIFAGDNNQLAQGESKSVTIPSGSNASSYELEIPDLADLATSWVVSYQCSSNCGIFQQNGFYTSAGTISNFENAEPLAGGANYSSIDLELLLPNTLSGTVSVPGATLTAPLTINLVTEDVNGFDEQTVPVTIAANGDNTAAFSIGISSSNTSSWKLSYQCDNACPGFVAPAFHNTAGTATTLSGASAFSGGTNVENIVFPLLTSAPISGLLSLPSGVNSPAEGSVVRISALDESVTTTPFRVLQKEVTIPFGQSSIAYQIDTIPDPAASWRVSYFCISGCAGFLNSGFYSSSGTVRKFADRTVLNGSITPFPTVNLNLIKADTFSGTLSLFDGQLAPAAGIEFRVTVESEDFSETFTEFYTIPAEQNSIPFSVKTISDVNIGWKLSHSCSTDCNGHSSRGYYTPAGTTAVRDESTSLIGGQNHPSKDMETLQTFVISGQVSLPNGELAPAGGFNVSVNIIDTVNQGNSSTSITIPEGANSSPYSLSISSDPNAIWTVRYACFFQANCIGRIDSAYNAGNTMVLNAVTAQQLAAAQNHSNIDLEIVNARIITGEISLPGDDVAPAGGIEVKMTAVAINGFETAEERTVTIPEGENFVSYQVDADPSSNQNWIVRYRCQTNCDGFLATGFYNINGSVESANQGSPLSPTQDHQSIDFSLIQSVLFEGEVILPNGNSVGDLEFTVVAERFTVVDEEVTTNLTLFDSVTILDGTDRADFSVSILLNGSDQWRLSYSCNENCEGLIDIAFYNSSGSVISEQNAEAIPATNTVSGLIFPILASVPVSGTFSLPDSLTAAADTTIKIQVGNADSSISAEQNIVLGSGQNAVNFDLLVPISGQNLKLSYSCVSPCIDIAASGFYNDTLGTQFLLADAQPLDGSQNNDGLSFVALKLTELSGSISTPFIAPDGVNTILVDLNLIDQNGDTQYLKTVIIPSDATTIDFEFNIEPDPAKSYTLGYNCKSNLTCLRFFNGFYQNLPDDFSTLDDTLATSLPANVDNTNIDFNMQQSVVIEGTITLPAGQIAPVGGISFVIGTRVPQSQLISENIFTSLITIPAGGNSSFYSAKISPNSTTDWRVFYLCNSGCEDVYQRGYYNISGTTAFAGAATLINADSPNLQSIDMRMLKNNTISGKVSLLQGRVAPAQGTELEVSGFDVNSGFTAIDTQTRVTIAAGQSSVNYSFGFPDRAAGNWRVRYECRSGCDDLTQFGYYSPTGTTVNFNDSQLLNGGSNHTNIDFLLLDEDAEFNNDDDGDGVLNDTDNCRFTPNSNQADRDGNGIGDLCDTVDEETCFPIPISAGKTAVICL